MNVMVGAARTDIPVPAGTALSGYAARTSGATGTHDPLTVRALAVGEIVFIAVDCCALHEDSCRLIRDQLIAAGAAEAVIAATHTHAGPCIGRGRVGVDDAAVRVAVERAAVETGSRSLTTARACHVGVREAVGVGVARDRRHLDTVIDPPVQGLIFRDVVDEAAVAALVTYPCHPVVLGAANTRVSADYVAALRDEVESALEGALCVFLTGAAGDVNDGHAATASFRAEAATGRDFATAAARGERIARALLDAKEREIDVDAARFSAVPVTPALTPVDRDLIALQRERWLRERQSATPDLRALLDIWIAWADSVPADPPHRWHGRVSCTRIGPVRIVALPGEPFLVAADRLRSSTSDPVFVLGYADGVPGYFPDRAAYPEGGYEVDDAHRYYGMPSPFAAGSLEELVAAAHALMHAE
ncbi:hypothetical protein [Microbacterium sp. ZW T5_56]|uniref:hypothetical protein n=1 Tax=Microbacterium sp. ZW T5_56 TaxID=3378081 RepID=UPI0038536A9D